MKKIGIVGATGYTGVELLRLLVNHPSIEITIVTSRANAGSRVDAMFPNLRGYLDLKFVEPDVDALCECDLVFFATPNGIAMQSTPTLLAAGTKVIDLAADFRIDDVSVWEEWYGMTHACPELLADAVYGLPELNREKIKNTNLVANPGCYPTAVTLGLLPLLKSGIAKLDDIIADVKSGVSGAGRKANVGTLLCESSESFKAYAVTGHRHQPEIAQNLSIVTGESVDLTFIPHLLPMIRGIEATLYVKKAKLDEDLDALYAGYYANEPFVDVLPEGTPPETRSVRGSNMCQISPNQPKYTDRIVILSVIDNLVKGAAGQAVQNMNIMLGFDETTALQLPALLP